MRKKNRISEPQSQFKKLAKKIDCSFHRNNTHINTSEKSKLPRSLQKSELRYIKLQGKKPVEKWQQDPSQYEYNYNDKELKTRQNTEKERNTDLVLPTTPSQWIVLGFDDQQSYKELKPYLPNTFTLKSRSTRGYHIRLKIYDVLEIQPAIENLEKIISKRIQKHRILLNSQTKPKNIATVQELEFHEKTR